MVQCGIRLQENDHDTIDIDFDFESDATIPAISVASVVSHFYIFQNLNMY